METNSYRDASEQLMDLLNISISHEAVRTIVLKAGEKILEKEAKEVELNKKDKLTPGTKQIPVLFEEADGLWINLQGKDRKEQIKQYKESCITEGKEYIEPTKVKSELKLYVSYDGWMLDDTRHSLVNKTYITGFMTSDELKKKRDAQIYQKYDLSKIELRILNGDGASWIGNLATKQTIQQRDNYHIHQEIIRNIQEDEYRRQLERLIAERRYDEVPIYLDYLKYELGGEEKALEKIDRLKSYLSEGLPRYQDVLEKENKKMPEAPKGIEYRDPGIMESQIFTVLTKRFKSGRLSFSKFGATCLAKICAIKVQDGSVQINIIEQKTIIDNSIEEYLKQVKESIKMARKSLIKLNKENDEYSSIKIENNSPIYELAKLTPISELDYII